MTIDPLKYRTIFLQEAEDQLSSYEEALLRLRPELYDGDALDTAYRAVHSLKAGADAVGLSDIARYSHAAERLLDRIRAEKTATPNELDRLLAAFDVLRGFVTSANDPEAGAPNLEKALAALEQPAPTLTEIPKKTPAVADEQAPVIDEPAAQPYLLTLAPERDAFQRGIDPMGMLWEVAKVATITKATLDIGRLPALDQLNPEECYLTWNVSLETGYPDEVLDVFAVCCDTLDVKLKPATAEAPVHVIGESKPSGAEGLPDPMVFLSYLVEAGQITSIEAMQALERQRESRPLIGRLAVETQRMKTEQIFKTLADIHDGEKFGQAAIRLGFLDEDKLSVLLFLQQQSVTPITEILIRFEFLDRNVLTRQLEAFRELARRSVVEHEFYIEQVESIVPLPAAATAGPASLDGNQSMIGDFCQEAAEHLGEADKHLLILDGEPTNAESLNAVYRAFHTIKGVASMLGLTGVQTIAHEAENLLNLARESKMVLQGRYLDLSFESCDAIRRQMELAKSWLNDGGKMAGDPKTPPLLEALKAAVRQVNSGGKEPVPALATATATATTTTTSNLVAAVPAKNHPAEPAPAPVPAADPGDHPTSGPRKGAGDNETVRVAKNRLDELINLIGELVIAHSMAKTEFDELSRESGAHSRALPELSKIARDIQELSFSLRMIPLQATFQRMSRLVRDLNRKIGKQVELKLEGEETELDKSVVDQLGDPLMHMVRNAVDHGLEGPADRLAAGKSETGRLTIRAFHQGGNVHIEIADDGRGLDRERIIKKAVEKGLIAPDARLTDSEAYNLIFAPGFSTAAAVTDVSGRGVGMDVVRRNVESLHGSIHIRTKLGQGTTFTIRLPLTLAILDGLMVGIGDDVYVLPLLSVIESFRPKPADIHTVSGRGELVTARGEVIPLIRLHQVLGRPARHSAVTRGIVVLVEDQGRKHALFVDELLGQMQAVVKSLDQNYQRVEGLAGATILGDGRVAMILDIHGLASLYSNGSISPTTDLETDSMFDSITRASNQYLPEGILS